MPDVVHRLNVALEGRYLVERELGEGGMADVYLADDLRHERRVAIKVLKPDLAALVGAERFLAEIKTTANLQHPHILPLFDSGEAGGFLFYVMPYVEGESLRHRLDREVQLPVDEAVRIAAAVATALGYAHRQGVIHRDVKPENVLMHDGQPLVADFGIALAVTAAGGSRLTETGLSLGTPYYMSPEQASADRELGPASDIYSVGCMLHEMLVGEPPYTGKTAQAVLAKILTERPRPVVARRATVPAHVAAVVARALERLPADRFESAEDFVRALEDRGFTHDVVAPPDEDAFETRPVGAMGGRSRVARWLPWGVAAAAAAVAFAALRPELPPTPGPTVRTTLADFVIATGGSGGWRIAISRDGSTIVAGGEDGFLHQRRSDDPEFRRIPGTERGRNPAVSPDGEWLVFNLPREGGLLKVQLSGGPVLPVTPEGDNPHWYTQDEIVYAAGGGVHRVPSAGGTGTLITDEITGRPFMLPGGRALIGDRNSSVFLYDIDAGEGREIAASGSNARYVPTGHVLYGDRALQSVLAVPFDLDALEVTGSAVPVLPSVNIFSGGAVQLAVSDNGVLVYGLANGDVARGGTAWLTWFDADGTRTETRERFVAGALRAPRVAPDGRRIAFFDSGEDRVLVYDAVTGEITEVATGDDRYPTWGPDGTLYISGDLQWLRVTDPRSGRSEPIRGWVNGYINDVSTDGDRLVIELWDEAAAGPDLAVGRLVGDSLELQSYLRASWHEEEGALSPDGRWLAYTSSESGDHRVMIRSFPEPGPAVLVSPSWGSQPMWSPAGDALYYAGTDSIVRVQILFEDGQAVLGETRGLFSTAGTENDFTVPMWDIHPEGRRFLAVTAEAALEQEPEEPRPPGIGPVVIVANWFEELRQRMGGSESRP